jgi:hypothetical protein
MPQKTVKMPKTNASQNCKKANDQCSEKTVKMAMNNATKNVKLPGQQIPFRF